MTTRGRPKLGNQIKLVFPAALLARIDEAAKSEGMTRSEWIRHACRTRLGIN